MSRPYCLLCISVTRHRSGNSSTTSHFTLTVGCERMSFGQCRCTTHLLTFCSTHSLLSTPPPRPPSPSPSTSTPIALPHLIPRHRDGANPTLLLPVILILPGTVANNRTHQAQHVGLTAVHRAHQKCAQRYFGAGTSCKAHTVCAHICHLAKSTLLTSSSYDLNSTFDVVVGSKTFSLYTAVFTKRSRFFCAARKPEWCREPKKPVDLEDEDPEVFNEYMNCVYFGQDALKVYADEYASSPEHQRSAKVSAEFRALVRLSLLADKLQDLTTANMTIDEVICFSDVTQIVPSRQYSDAYRCTARNNPMRFLMRDYYLYEQSLPGAEQVLEDLPRELVDDIMLEILRIKRVNKDETVKTAFGRRLNAFTQKDPCHYHQHDDKHPRCDPKPKSD